MSRSLLFLCSSVIAVGVASACGSSSDKRSSRPHHAEAGSGAVGGETAPSSGGSSAGQPSDNMTAGAAGADPNAGGAAGAGGDSGEGGSPSGDYPLGFYVSNVTEDVPAPGSLIDWVYDENTQLDTDDLKWGFVFRPEPTPIVIELADGSEAALIVVKSLKVVSGARLALMGRRPLIIAVQGDAEIEGLIDPAQDPADTGGWVAGGAPGPNGAERAGIGPGGGGAGLAAATSATGGGGAGFCGKGGAGSHGVAGGSTYGTAELIPLLGGSSGGTSTFDWGGWTSSNNPNWVGRGGGAIQISAGGRLVIGDTGMLSMGGRAGRSGSGGGSGGAILLEAPNVEVRGVLAANGGPGSGAARTQDASTTYTPAPGSDFGGGRGSAGELNDGGDGTPPSDNSYPAGGGGGAGRIRINSKLAAQFAPSAVITPTTESGCATIGQLP